MEKKESFLAEFLYLKNNFKQNFKAPPSFQLNPTHFVLNFYEVEEIHNTIFNLFSLQTEVSYSNASQRLV